MPSRRAGARLGAWRSRRRAPTRPTGCCRNGSGWSLNRRTARAVFQGAPEVRDLDRRLVVVQESSQALEDGIYDQMQLLA